MSWQTNPNTPPLAAMRAVLELVKPNEKPADETEAQVRLLIGQLSIQSSSLMRLSLLLDVSVQFNLDTHPMVEVMLCELSETANRIMSMSDQLRILVSTSDPSLWILVNRKTIFRGFNAFEEITDMCLDYHNVI